MMPYIFRVSSVPHVVSTQAHGAATTHPGAPLQRDDALHEPCHKRDCYSRLGWRCESTRMSDTVLAGRLQAMQRVLGIFTTLGFAKCAQRGLVKDKSGLAAFRRDCNWSAFYASRWRGGAALKERRWMSDQGRSGFRRLDRIVELLRPSDDTDADLLRCFFSPIGLYLDNGDE